MGHDVFISYSHRDQKMANAACARLEQAGHRCWIAPRDVGGGAWGMRIMEGIRGARVFVLIFSGHANLSEQVNREVERAVNKGLPIVPLRIEDVLPSDALEYFIGNQHWLDALTPPLERHLDHLVEVVGGLLGREAPVRPVPLPKTPQNKSLKWWAGGIAAAMGLTAIGAWMLLGREHPADSVDVRATVPAPQAALKATPAPIAVPGPSPPLQPLLADWASQRPETEPSGTVDAEPSLRHAAVAVSVDQVSSVGGRLVFTHTRNLYDVESARLSERIGDGGNLLVFQQSGQEPAIFTLRFAVPLAEVRFATPRVINHFPHQPGNPISPVYPIRVTSPEFTATALDQAGQPIAGAQVTRLDQLDDLRATTFTLRASGSQGIAAVRFATTGVLRFHCFCQPDGTQLRSFYYAFMFSDFQIRRRASAAPPGGQ